MGWECLGPRDHSFRMEQCCSLAFGLETLKGLHMPSSQLKRAERAIQAIRDQAELPPEAADALQELVDIVRTIEDRVSTLEKAKVVPT
jgi:uncharacterized membrane protein YccC